MKIKILELIDGAKKAEGLTVIIDVFRAFTLETYLFAQGAEKIYPVGEMAEAFALKEQHPDWLLFGIENIDFTGKTIIHSTSAGTQGIINATGADEIITACLTNARAVAEYIRARDPEVVSLVAMGNSGVRRANEDLLCAEYIQSILKNEPIAVTAAAEELKRNGGEHFFDENRQHIFPEADFYCSIKVDRFPFVIRIEKDEDGRFVALKYTEKNQ